MKVFPAGVPDNEIAEFTDHKSEGPILDIIIALCAYIPLLIR